MAGRRRLERADSGKLARLREIADEIASRQEKVLVYTQFANLGRPIVRVPRIMLRSDRALVLHGQIPISRRARLVESFQREDGPPFFVLSLKAGGSGLNLTAASHVIHFDRWWNPAVEDQATDRAFRIGQRRNVLVHKFICRGTIEEKIDQMIESKRQLSRELLEGGADLLLTELNDDELLKLVALDLNKALKEA